MSVQFIIGPSGCGKSSFITRQLIEESIKNQDTNYILFVPEQFSSEKQREIVEQHPNHAFMNIDIIGINRMCGLIFEEQKKPMPEVLEDFGKSMLVRFISGRIKKELKIYGGSIDKMGFVDEVKSLLSELLVYNITTDMIDGCIEKLDEGDVLREKLSDISKIYRSFEEGIGEAKIPAEEKVKLLAEAVRESDYIKNSVIYVDGFTGFTPAQLKLVRELFLYAPKVYVCITIDREYFLRDNVKEHELFYLSSQTVSDLRRVISEAGIKEEESIYIDGSKNDRRFLGHDMLYHLERNIFRFPYEVYEDSKSKDISIIECRNKREEIQIVAERIRESIRNGRRLKDIAVITADMENSASYIEEIFDSYEIPYFLDYSRPLKHNPFADTIISALSIIENGFDYDSIFYFMKAGVYVEIDEDSIDGLEKLENYMIRRGLRGYKAWSRHMPITADIEAEDARREFMEVISPIYKVFKVNKASVKDCVAAIKEFVVKLEYERKISELSERLYEEGKLSEAKVYEKLYGHIEGLLDKMEDIIPDSVLTVHEFSEILSAGLNDIEMGIIPPTLDKVVIGDLTRTRLGDIKELFLINVNEGVIPKVPDSGNLISDRDKDRLKMLGITLAPTDKENSFTDQFYLYLMMTRMSEKLTLTYSILSMSNKEERPAYIISRLQKVFPSLEVEKVEPRPFLGTFQSDRMFLASEIRRRMDETDIDYDEASDELMSLAAMFYVYQKEHPELLQTMEEAFATNWKTSLNTLAKNIIYKNTDTTTVSMLEMFQKCPYSYFMQFVLGLKERRKSSYDNRNVGDILHFALKNTFETVKLDYKQDWKGIDDNTLADIMERYIVIASNEEDKGITAEDAKSRYLRNSLIDIGRKTILTIRNQIVAGSMLPKYLEKPFNLKKDSEAAVIHAETKDLKLRGVVDRADVYEDDNNVFVNVIDYKTGDKQFKIEEVYEGLSLQLLVYLNVMMDIADSDYKGKNVVPTGMYYCHVDDPITSIDKDVADEAELAQLRNKDQRLRGMLNADMDIMKLQEKDIAEKTEGEVLPVDFKKDGFKSNVVATDTEGFKSLCKYGQKKLEEICNRILGGDIKKSPVKTGKNAQCNYCIYQDVCRFGATGSGKFREFKYSAEQKRAALNEMTNAYRSDNRSVNDNSNKEGNKEGDEE